MACAAEQRRVDSLQGKVDALSARETATAEICASPDPRVNNQCAVRQETDARVRADLEGQLAAAQDALAACQAA